MMQDIMKDYYNHELASKGFYPASDFHNYCTLGSTWELSPELGSGTYWIYNHDNLFDINIHDFYFHEDMLFDFHVPRSLSITQYDSISGEQLSPYRRLEARSITTLIGGNDHYYFRVHKNVLIRSIGIEIMPAYYEDYLKTQFPNEYLNPIEAFASIDQTDDFPQMAKLLNQIKHYRGEGLSAKLFFKGKVDEAVSLIVERHQLLNNKAKTIKTFSSDDLKRLHTTAAFLNDHYAQDTTIKELTQIACMSASKLQTYFKAYYQCTITQYIQQRRMSQAEYLLSSTALNIGQVAEAVGYTKASRFSELFRKSTGILPNEYRKLTYH